MTPALIRALVDHAAAAWPRECCGLIVQTPTGLAARRGTNLLPDRHRFELAPAVLFAARRDRTPIVAIYHSHCDAPATPSAADAAFARHWPGVAQVIVAVRKGRAIRIFVASDDASAIEPGNFEVREWNDSGAFAAADDPE